MKRYENAIKNWPKDEKPREKLLKFGEASGKGRSSRLQSAFREGVADFSLRVIRRSGCHNS